MQSAVPKGSLWLPLAFSAVIAAAGCSGAAEEEEEEESVQAAVRAGVELVRPAELTEPGLQRWSWRAASGTPRGRG